ncbi:MAG: hypothetical protein AAB375_03745 [Patescibacteria group bacterium]
MVDISVIVASLGRGFSLAFEYWWAWLPLILAATAHSAWMDYQKEKYLAGMKWILLEVIPPPEILYSSPKAAENFFASLHSSYGGGVKWREQMFGGKIPDWFTLEIVSNGGPTHFFIRCTEGSRNVVEALIFAQYPQAEIKIAEDYTKLLPAEFDPSQYDVSGTEFVFTQPPAYPIKSWTEFEEAGGKDEYARLDPLAPLLEIMSALQPSEYLWLQYVIRPTGGDWVKEGKKVVDKLVGREEKAPEDPFLVKVISLPFKLIGAILTEIGALPAVEEKKKEEKPFSLQSLTPAEKQTLEQIQIKLSKLAFKACVRVLYTARKESFNGARASSVGAMFKQLFYNNMNSFKPGPGTKDKGVLPWMFPNDKGFFFEERTLKKKKGMYGAYRKRAFSAPPKDPKNHAIILNTEELATLWHLPGLNVKAPMMPRVQSKKGQPPAMLPTR